jgi:hypothetical protein
VWAKGLLCLEAAVELLIGNRSWLFREDFLEIAVEFGWEVYSRRPMAGLPQLVGNSGPDRSRFSWSGMREGA